VSYVCTQWPIKSRVFAPIFDDFACSYKNEGSIPFTRSTLFLSKFAVFQATVIRVSYEAARISPVSLGFQPRNRNRGSGADDPTDGLALSLIHCRKKHGAPTSCPLERCEVEAVSQILQLLCAWDANSAVASPACLGLETSVVEWPGMKIIRRRVSVTPV
jgi:hypothetical protein